jgi:PEP-CTERM motif
MKTPRLIFCVAFLTAASASLGDVVAPNLTETAGTTGLNTVLRNAPRTYEEYLAANNFSSLAVPTLFTGMQFRLALGTASGIAAGGTWPSQAITFTDYTVQLSVASAQLIADGEYLSTTPTFASYQGANVTTVRTGPLVITPNSFTNNGNASPNPFGFTINFTTPYLFTPGDSLVVLIRLAGYTPAGEFQAFFASTNFLNGTTDAISNTTSASATVPNGFSSPVFINFITVAVPEPGTTTLIGFGLCVGLAATLRRRAAR